MLVLIPVQNSMSRPVNLGYVYPSQWTEGAYKAIQNTQANGSHGPAKNLE